MKVVFLDIDGVLNCKQTPNPRKFPFIVDPVLLKRLGRLLDLADAQAVLTSNWRHDPAGMFSARSIVIARCWKSRQTPFFSLQTSAAVLVARAY